MEESRPGGDIKKYVVMNREESKGNDLCWGNIENSSSVAVALRSITVSNGTFLK